jgi:excisionase family DNA binding protein
MEKRLLTVNDLSDYLSMSKGSIYTKVCLGKIPGVIKIGRSLRFEKVKIDAWINQKSSLNSVQEYK